MALSVDIQAIAIYFVETKLYNRLYSVIRITRATFITIYYKQYQASVRRYINNRKGKSTKQNFL